MARAGLRICDPRHIRRNSQISSQCSVIRQSVAERRLRREGVVARERVFLQLTFLEAIMKEALQPTLVLVLWIVFWLAGTLGGAVLQAWLIDIGVLSEIDPPWIITIGSSFVGFFAGAYAAVKLGDLALKQK